MYRVKVNGSYQYGEYYTYGQALEACGEDGEVVNVLTEWLYTFFGNQYVATKKMKGNMEVWEHNCPEAVCNAWSELMNDLEWR